MDNVDPTARRAALEARRSQLSAEKRALFQKRVAGEMSAPNERPACLVPLSEGTGAPLFCIHPAGGDVLCFAPLSQRLPGRRVFGLQSPGMEGEQEPFVRMEDLAEHFAAVISAAQPRGPFLLAGWSLGAQVAFEVARTLVRRGQRVSLLALLDADPGAGEDAAKSYPTAESFVDHASWLQGIADYLERLWGQKIALSLGDLKGLDPESQLEAFIQGLQGMRVANIRVPSKEQLRRVLAVFKANVQALIGYHPQVYSGKLTLFQTEGSSSWADRAREGWSKLSTVPVETRQVPGDHYAMLVPPSVDALATALSDLLDRAAGEAQ